jgi:hypothetical protein
LAVKDTKYHAKSRYVRHPRTPDWLERIASSHLHGKKFRAEKRPDNRGGLFVTKAVAVGLVLSVVLAFATAPAASAKELKVRSDKIVTGLGHVECVGYDARRKVFHASDFGPASSRPTKTAKAKSPSSRSTEKSSTQLSCPLKAE